MSDLDSLRYPIGRFQRILAPLQPSARAALIETIAAMPAEYRRAVEPLTPAQLDRPYRPGGWTIRQVVHHVPDSHAQAYARMKLALTEDQPAIKTYNETLWAELPDTAATPVAVSLALLDALHQRWTTLLRQLPPASFQRAFFHPEWGAVTLDEAVGQYEWHGRHHLAHIRQALLGGGAAGPAVGTVGSRANP